MATLSASTALALNAQTDSSHFHATLRGWAEHTWLQILDRNGAREGRLGEAGVLQRFHEDIDGEYELDKIAARFALVEEYEWYERANGFRWRSGSTTARELAIAAEFKTAVPLGGGWTFGVRADLEENTEASRQVVRVSLVHRWQTGIYAFVESSLDAVKPGSDLEIGVGWQGGRSSDLTLTGSLAVLDWWSDFIYLNLGAAKQSQTDSTLEYETQPLAFQLRSVIPLARRFRLEAYGAITRPSSVLAYAGLARDSGFRQEEQVGFVGGLAEWAAATPVRLGIFATYIRARTERTALAPGLLVENYTLVEEAIRTGGLVMARLTGPLSLELWVAREWRPERRERLASTQPDDDYEDRAWSGQLVLQHLPQDGFTATLGVVLDRRDVIRGARHASLEAAQFNQDNYRARFDVGWRFGNKVFFLVGWGIDLDGDGVGRYSGGGRGRFAVYW